MARKTPPKGSRKSREDEASVSARRTTPPPPAGLPIMPRPFEVDNIRDDGRTIFEVEATPGEREALAAAYNLPGLAALTGRFNLVKRGRTVIVTGQVKAHVTQDCVVTMEPFESDVEDDVDMEYAPESLVAEAWERVAKAEASGSNAPVEDPPDPIVDGRIDLGALTAETLALALDPYPKKPGVAFEDPEDPEAGPDESPFAVLARLKGDNEPRS